MHIMLHFRKSRGELMQYYTVLLPSLLPLDARCFDLNVQIIADR